MNRRRQKVEGTYPGIIVAPVTFVLTVNYIESIGSLNVE
jgi:hypothetical protein